MLRPSMNRPMRSVTSTASAATTPPPATSTSASTSATRPDSANPLNKKSPNIPKVTRAYVLQTFARMSNPDAAHYLGVAVTTGNYALAEAITAKARYEGKNRGIVKQEHNEERVRGGGISQLTAQHRARRLSTTSSSGSHRSKVVKVIPARRPQVSRRRPAEPQVPTPKATVAVRPTIPTLIAILDELDAKAKTPSLGSASSSSHPTSTDSQRLTPDSTAGAEQDSDRGAQTAGSFVKGGQDTLPPLRRLPIDTPSADDAQAVAGASAVDGDATPLFKYLPLSPACYSDGSSLSAAEFYWAQNHPE